MIRGGHDWIARAKAFEKEAHVILSVHESAASRIVLLTDTYSKLTVLSLKQDDLMRQALRCVENGLFRAAHVMAWAAFMDFLEEKLSVDGLAMVRALRPKWRASSVEELREYQTEYHILELTQPLKLATKNQKKALQGLLNKRNECAHPSGYYPEMNDTLGYITELLQRISTIAPKTI
ncbi:MAG: hypothetical protein IH957_00335 [Chloroflexi bacterium]|nr:hypothetical protein [Chloroflexota bacterium]